MRGIPDPVINQFDRTESAQAPPRGHSRPVSPTWLSARSTRVRRSARYSAFAISPAVAVLYAALGIATLAVGQLAGLAAPVWPAAGVALAAALRWRWRALPGIFAGSVVVNMVWLTGLAEPEPKPWLTAAVIGLGSVLGAATGATLVRRFVGPVRRLDTPRAVLLALALGGLLASTVAPTVGIAAEIATGLLSPSQAGMGWLIWWVGDAVGVIVVAPLVLMLLPSQARYWAGRRWKIAVPSVLIVGSLMAAILQNGAQERARIDTAVEQLGDQAANDLASNIAVHQEVLEGLHSLVDATGNLTAQEFDDYTDGVLARFPNLQALSWNPLVTQADLAAFQARQRAQPGLATFTVTERDAVGNLRPVSARPEYVVVAYIEPIASNRNALGFDILSNPLRAAAIETARDTARPTATAPIDLVQESSTQKGMLALLPIYRGGSDPGNESARRVGLRGFAVGVYRLGDLLTQTFSDSAWDAVDITLTDVSDPADPIVIADLPARDTSTADTASTAPTATTSPLDVYGRTWELTVRPLSTAFADNGQGMTVILLLAALTLAFLLEGFLLVLSGMDSLARRLMSELGAAARYVASILPSDLDSPVPVTSRYVPSQELGGDSFDYRFVDDDHLIVYLVDVSGHGIAPALFSVSAHNLLRSGTLDNDTLRDPGRVLTELNRLFQMDQQAGNYFTIWYGVYQPSTRTLRYSGAGHPPAIVLTANGTDPVRLPSESIPIGVLEDTTFETHSYQLPPDTDLMIYSDGAFELDLRDGGAWSLGDFIGLCARTAARPGWTLDDLIARIRERSMSGVFEDDCTLVRVSATSRKPDC